MIRDYKGRFGMRLRACGENQGFGYLAIAAMIFGNWKIGPTTLACLVFGLAKSGGLQLCIAAGLPSNSTDIFLTLPYVLTLLLVFFSKKNRPPKAGGIRANENGTSRQSCFRGVLPVNPGLA